MDRSIQMFSCLGLVLLVNLEVQGSILTVDNEKTICVNSYRHLQIIGDINATVPFSVYLVKCLSFCNGLGFSHFKLLPKGNTCHFFISNSLSRLPTGSADTSFAPVLWLLCLECTHFVSTITSDCHVAFNLLFIGVPHLVGSAEGRWICEDSTRLSLVPSTVDLCTNISGSILFLPLKFLSQRTRLFMAISVPISCLFHFSNIISTCIMWISLAKYSFDRGLL